MDILGVDRRGGLVAYPILGTSMTSVREYAEVYGPEEKAAKGKPHGWIQWKGTDVRVDLNCPCGHAGHFDGEFFYAYECGGCGAKYAVGQVVNLIPLDGQQAKWFDHYNTDTE